MTKGDLRLAIDQACADGLKRMFGILASNLIEQTAEQAAAEFKAGVDFHLRAHVIATATIEQVPTR